MVNCAMFGCNNHSKKKSGDQNASDVGFFCIPKVTVNQSKQTKEVTERRRAEWLRRINRKDLENSATHYRVCCIHLISGRPSYAMGESDPEFRTRGRLCILDTESQGAATVPYPEKRDFGQNTELTMLQIQLLEDENNRLLSELVETKSKLGTYMLTEDCLKEKPDMLQFYSGLPSFDLLWAFFLVLEGSVSHKSQNCFTKFQEMLVFLIRLRLNVPLQD
ncbi:hypothetical protein HPB49_013385 [Dermacentor silvarum]|uniref:Uncharacterized protein n=1 Tax=Dermacentor silvarum TaxID=543639 RepID=A0ACB8C3V7_DERSI|nr:hypothetical protein HPB49_013385 [Dermacentor silvarum]